LLLPFCINGEEVFQIVRFELVVNGISLDRSEQVCNGHAALCNRKYGNTTFLGSHDSFAFSGNPLACEFPFPSVIECRTFMLGFLVARTQEIGIEAQLKLGVRALQVQAHL
jgi:hypothetical protein